MRKNSSPELQQAQQQLFQRGISSGRGKLDHLQVSPYSSAHQRRERRKRGQHSQSQDATGNKNSNGRGSSGTSGVGQQQRARTDSRDDEDGEEDEYSYNEISVEQQVDSAMMKCNSPFLDAIFGASGDKKDMSQRANWDRQRLAYDILSEPVNISSAAKGRGPHAISGGASASYTTTTETQSDISSISEMVSGITQSDTLHPRLRRKRRGESGKNDSDVNVDKDTPKTSRALSTPPDSVTRIIAPNVEKLPAHSVVEIVLQGDEVVSVLCSVDTLKMRSEYFFEHLSALERKSDEQSSIGTVPLVIEDPSPYEAAAYLESMHDGGKSLSMRGSWSYHFARLSVQWRVEDLIVESASALDAFIENTLKTVERHHWRTNPSILAGRPVAILPQRQGGGKPEFILGTVMELPAGDSSLPYSTLRVRVESNQSPSTTPRAASTPPPQAAAAPPPRQTMTDISNSSFLARRETFRARAETEGKGVEEDARAGVTNAVAWTDFETTVSSDEDFRVDSRLRVLVKQKEEWADPDELFVEEAKTLLSPADGIYFWEMLRAILELPSLQSQCKGRIQSPQHIVDVLVRKEFRCLWSYHSKKLPGFLPKKYALQLIQHAFCD